MKVLQKIARFVSVLIGILIRRYQRTSKWCSKCTHQNTTHDCGTPCYRCITQKQLGKYFSKPSNFTSNSKERED